jgi:uncharacterized protein (TIGR03067 family)
MPTHHPDLVSLEGKWKVRSVTGNGDFRWRMLTVGEAVHIENVSLQLPDIGDSGAMIHDYYVASPNKTPKEFDLTFWVDNLNATQHGIYQLDGDTLTLCVASHNSEERPARFVAEAGKGTIFVLDRIVTTAVPSKSTTTTPQR